MKIEEGTVDAIFNDQKQNPLYNTPVLQIVTLQKLGSNGSDKIRYRAGLSDGIHYIRTVFSSDLAHLFDKNLISKYSIVKIDRFFVRSMGKNTYLYVQEIKEFEKCSIEIGKPVNIETGRASLNEPQKNTENNNVVANSEVEKTKDVSAGDIEVAKRPKNVSNNDSSQIALINEINPFHNKWMIKGRIVMKSEIKKFSNKRGEGKLFSFELADDSGQIKIVAFSECVDIFYPIIEVGKVYTVKKGMVKMANKQFSNNNCDYEIQLDQNSEIQLVLDNEAPKYFFNFTKINDISPTSHMYDVISVVKESYPATSFVVKSTQRESLRKDLLLVDETGSIKCTLWGSKAEIEINSGDVVAIKTIKASDFNGFSLSSNNSSQVHINPDIPEAHKILGWYEKEGKDIKIEVPERDPRIDVISDVKYKELVFSTVKVSIMYFRENSMFYESCKGEGCTKKVFRNDLGEYRCEKCNKTFEDCNYRFMVSVNISDYTGQIWGTMFDEQATGLFNCSAEDFKRMSEEDPRESQTFVRKFAFRDFVVKLKSRKDMYNDEAILRYNIISIKPINYVEETKKNLSLIEKVISSA